MKLSVFTKIVKTFVFYVSFVATYVITREWFVVLKIVDFHASWVEPGDIS